MVNPKTPVDFAHAFIASGTGVPPGRYYIRTCEHGPGGQPAGWGLAAWKDLANRNGSSAWVHVHSNDEWASQWDIQPGKTAGSYRIKFYSGNGGNAKVSLSVSASSSP